ncbi:MAG TPA: phosphopantetheine-binding protein [Vicinamibacteria bacterium]|nr:phosphopantetheine-binding protein [Vicinamibacteria bacterium]
MPAIRGRGTEDADEAGQAHPRPATLRNPFVAPRNRTEGKIAQIWQKFMALDTIGVHDNFFDLGGHSLMGTQLMAKVREALEVDFAMAVLYEAPTVAEMAARVEEAHAGEEAREASA